MITGLYIPQRFRHRSGRIVTVIIDYYKRFFRDCDNNRESYMIHLLQSRANYINVLMHFHPDHFNREILT